MARLAVFLIIFPVFCTNGYSIGNEIEDIKDRVKNTIDTTSEEIIKSRHKYGKFHDMITDNVNDFNNDGINAEKFEDARFKTTKLKNSFKNIENEKSKLKINKKKYNAKLAKDKMRRDNKKFLGEMKHSKNLRDFVENIESKKLVKKSIETKPPVDFKGIKDEIKTETAFELKDPFWVLNLTDDLDALTLERGTWWQEEAFDNAIAATVAASKRRNVNQNNATSNHEPASKKVTNEEKSTDLKSNDGNSAVTDNKHEPTDIELKNEVMRLVNKFILHVSKLPESYLTDSGIEGEPSLVIKFKGNYTVFTVKYGKYQWHLTMGPDSPLPEWFYQPRNTTEDQVVPIDVKKELFKILVHMLNAFLRFPL